jgi:hypothetical protein
VRHLEKYLPERIAGGQVDLATSLKVLVRRWYATLPFLALTTVAVLMAAQAVRPAYQATATVVLLAPTPEPGATHSPGPADRNPYLRFDKNLEVTAALMSTILTNSTMVERLRAAGATSTYDIATSSLGAVTRDASPLLEVTAVGPDEQSAERTVAIVVHYLGVELARRQRAAGAPADALIRTQVTTPPTITGRIIGSTVRATGAAALLGLALSVGAGQLAETAAARRRRRRQLQQSRQAMHLPATGPAPAIGAGPTPATDLRAQAQGEDPQARIERVS